MTQPGFGVPQPEQPEGGQQPGLDQPSHYGEVSDYETPQYGGTQPYGEAPPQAYGQTPPPGYGQQPPAYGQQQMQPNYGYSGVPQEHPQAQTVLILGIVGIFVSVVSFIAWYMGSKAKKEIEAGAPYEWGGNLKVGYLLGKIISIIVIAAVALSIVFVLFGIVAAMSAG